jgi:3-deoxy-D-arabino-heptulosonate 7-phosphate (DAHP) synthase
MDIKVRHNPDRYFGSDLNKFIFENCGKKMVVNDIDLIMLKHRKGKNDILRVIESKHTKEKPMIISQKNVLNKLAQVFHQGNSSNIGIDLELYVVYGDQPYNKLRICDQINGKTFTIKGRSRVIKWLEME